MSFLKQVGPAFNRSPAPALPLRRRMLEVLEELYSKSRWFAPFDQYPSPKQLVVIAEEQLDLCDDKASPGFPLVWQGVSENKQVKSKKELRAQVVAKFIYLVECLRRGEKLPMCYVRIFIKPEPHKIEKIKEGRLRMIWAMPLEYQMLHRWILGPSLQSELRNFQNLPTKVGFSWLRGGAHQIYTSIDDGSDKIADGDMKGWDLSTASWTIEDERECRWRLCVNQSRPFKHALWECYETLLKSYVIFSDGTVCEQLEPGIVRSGSLITISGNSKMQIILKALYCLDRKGEYSDAKHRSIAQGDDTLGRFHGIDETDYVGWLKQHGYTMKEIRVGKMRDMTFCSHKFIEDKGWTVPVPQNWDKHVYALVFKEKSRTQYFAQQCFSLMLEYAFVPDRFYELADVVRRETPEFCYSIDYFQNLMKGFESGNEVGEFELPWTKEYCLKNLISDPLCTMLCSVLGLRLQGVRIRLVRDQERGSRLRQFLLALWLFLALLGLTVGVSQQTRKIEITDFGAPVKVFEEFVAPPLKKFIEGVDFAEDLAVGFQLAAKTNLAHAILLNEIQGARTKIGKPSYKPSPNQGKDTRKRIKIEGYEHSEGWKDREDPYKEPEMGKKQKGKGVKGAVKAIKQAAVAAAKQEIKQAVKSARSTKKVVLSRAAMKSIRNPKGIGAPEGISTNEMARYKGKELLTTLFLSGANSGSTMGKDVPGTMLYGQQLRPSELIPNARLGKLMSLYVKWRGRLRFSFESGIPEATNAGDMLFVHEPNPLEVIPTQFAPPVGGALSNYDSHSYKQFIPMAKKKGDGTTFPGLHCSSAAAKGTQGGWFLIDNENTAPLLDSSMGWILIFVQNAHNILGANAALPTATYPIGNLFIEYDIMVQSASDNGSTSSGGYSYYSAQGVATQRYDCPGDPSSNSFFAMGNNAQNRWNVISNQNGVIMNCRLSSNGVSEQWQFPEAGVYMVSIFNAPGGDADFGSTYTGYNRAFALSGTASILESKSVGADAATSAATTSCATSAELTISIDNPQTDLVQVAWTTGTGGTITASASFVTYLKVVALPPDTVSKFRKKRAEEKKELDLLTSMRPKLEQMFELWREERKEDRQERKVDLSGKLTQDDLDSWDEPEFKQKEPPTPPQKSLVVKVPSRKA